MYLLCNQSKVWYKCSRDLLVPCSRSNYLEHQQQQKFPLPPEKGNNSPPQCATPVFISISALEQYTLCTPIAIPFTPGSYRVQRSWLSKAPRKSRHAVDEEIRRAGMKALLGSSEPCCLSLLPDKAKYPLICL